jgi:hypothetical protein
VGHTVYFDMVEMCFVCCWQIDVSSERVTSSVKICEDYFQILLFNSTGVIDIGTVAL